MPGRGVRRREGRRGPGGLLALVVVAFLLVGQGVPLYSDWLWFQEVGLTPVFMTILKARTLLALLFGAAFFFLLYANLRLAGRAMSGDVLLDLDDQFGLPSRLVIEPYFKRFLAPAVLVLSLFSALQASNEWDTYVKLINAVPFRVNDPLFGRDIGFYVFRLPGLTYLYGWLMVSLGVTLVLTGVTYVLYRGIQITTRGPVFTRRARAHLFTLAGLLLVLKAAGYQLDAWNLLYSPRGAAFGASYADINAQLPAYRLLILLALLTAVLCWVQIGRRGFRLILSGLALLAAVSVVGLGIYPSVIQRFRVVPNEIAAERPYIDLNIKYTRLAYGLDKIEESEFPAEEALTAEDLRRNDPTVKNIRLWDHRPLLKTFAQLQEIRTYYKFGEVDNDRYWIDGEYRQVMLSPRELSYRNLPGGRTWINEHLIYTHGYGLTLGPVNRISPEGLPELLIKDIPPVSLGPIAVKRPEIYYGEVGNDYVFVKTRQQELDYPSGAENVYTTYGGTGGVPVRSFIRKLLFLVRFGNINILLNTDITGESRIMYYREIEERVRKAAPFIRFDRDPYMVISDQGRLVWIIDGYTVTDRFPYAEPVRGLGNYIRNAVKATVDAYDGTLAFYVAEPGDPVIQAYSRAFPGLFKPLAAMPPDLRAHLRYPPEMFMIQARLYATYHMRDPQVFYNKEDLWGIPKKAVDGQERDMEPYYTIMRLPGESREEFILLIPFTPSRKDNMSAWLAARSDPPNYGKLLVYNFPKQKLIYGPRQIEARIDQDAVISQQLSLWSQRGSAVIRGSLLAIPIEKSLIYVEPLYLAAERGSLPELKRVIVAFGNKIAMEETLDLSLQQIFGGKAPAAAARASAAGLPALAPAARADDTSIRALTSQALEHFGRAQDFLRQGNFAGYGEELKRLEAVLRTLRERAR